MKIIISPYSKPLRNGKMNPKNFPYWEELIGLLESENHEITQIGITGEKPLIQSVANVIFDLNLKELKELVNQHDIFISVDNFFPHFCHNCSNIGGIVIFSQSDPNIFGYNENINLLKDKKFLRKNQFLSWENSDYIEDAFVKPSDVMIAVTKLSS